MASLYTVKSAFLMIIIDNDSKGVSANTPQDSQGSPSDAAPPSFDESVDHVMLDFSQRNAPGGEDSPPEFTPYEADYFKAKNGCIISHDPHLNEDGEALYRFLLSQAVSPPTYHLHCRGTHDESRTRVVSHTNKHGRVRQRSESYTETVTDFDFMIDIGCNIPSTSGPDHWSVPDSEPAYRGGMVREVELGLSEARVVGQHRRKATKPEVKVFKAWVDERREKGLPPWVGSESRRNEHGFITLNEYGGLRSSKTLRNWADEYCTSKKHLKEFTYEKVVHGWDIDALKSAIRTMITSTSYAETVDVSMEYASNKIYVRPNNRLSRTLSNPWLKFLMFITLVYPFVWLFKRFHTRGGGRWEVCGGAYALKQLVPAGHGHDLEFKVNISQQPGSQTGTGSTTVLGLKEGQWFRQWEGGIKRAVITRFQSSVPLTEPPIDDLTNGVASLLDGYNDAA